MKYDIYKGIIIYIRVFEGSIKPGVRIRFMNVGKEFDVQEVGIFAPAISPVKMLSAGEVGYITCNLHDPKEVRVGDTVTEAGTSDGQAFGRLSSAETSGLLRGLSGQLPGIMRLYGKLLINYACQTPALFMSMKHPSLSDMVSVADFGAFAYGDRAGTPGA
jgi:hypothetical protein